jgi:CubicO group peptidase (beta-lactamase class C family)
VVLGDVRLREQLIEAPRDVRIAARSDGMAQDADHEAISRLMALPGGALDGSEEIVRHGDRGLPKRHWYSFWYSPKEYHKNGHPPVASLSGVRLGGGHHRAELVLVLLMVALAGCAAPTHPAQGSSAGPGSAASAAPSGPRFASGGPDAEEYGAGEGYPVKGIYGARFFVGNFSHYDQIFEGRMVRRAVTPSPLARASAEPALRYEYQAGTFTVDEYLARNPATGLLIARGDTILVERYQYARNDRHRFTSFSMAKTVTAMLIGIAIAEGRIRSVDDPAAAYVPELAGAEYGRTSLRHLLEMSSGVRFIERYSGHDDVAQLWAATVLQAGTGGVAAVKPYNERLRSGGTIFTYASVETQVLGLVLRGAAGRPVADYLQETIWQPMGAEADATWLVDRSGQEAVYCCLNAVLRDYARLGLLLAHDGRRGDRQIIPAAWVRAATTVPPDSWHLKPYAATRYFGYGYQTWIFPGERRMFALLGVHGQAIYVDPASRLVMVHTAVSQQPEERNVEALALWRAAVRQLGG